MSYAAEEWARAHRDFLGDDPCARAVLVELAVFHNRETNQCNPGQGALAKRLGYKKSQTVGEAIVRLEQLGLITRAFKYSRAGTILSTDYTLVGFRCEEWVGDQIKPSLERVAQQVMEYAAKRGMPNNGVLRSKQEGMPKNGIGYAEKRSRGTPLNGINQVIEQGKNKEREQVVLRASSAADAAPGPQADPACTSAPSGYEDSLYAEADLFAAQQKENAEPPEFAFSQPEALQATHTSPASAKAKKGPSACVETASEKPKSKFPACPYEKIVDLYHDTCPLLPQVLLITDERKRRIKARWLQLCKSDEFHTEAEALDGMRVFFERVSKSKFLNGLQDPSPGHTRAFRANLDFLMSPTKFINVFEGLYDNGSFTQAH